MYLDERKLIVERLDETLQGLNESQKLQISHSFIDLMLELKGRYKDGEEFRYFESEDRELLNGIRLEVKERYESDE